MNADALISRLHKVRKSGADSWLACCPAHDDKTPSLTIRETQDGRVLVHCFAGCTTENVLGSVGLSFADIEPERAISQRIKPERTKFYSTDLIKAISFESRVIMVAAYDMAKGRKLSKDDMERLTLAYERIQTATEMNNGN